MKLLREFITPAEKLVECVVLTEGAERNVIIRGIFAQADLVNKNGRCYPKAIMERESYKLQKKIATNSLVGELDHPKEPDMQLKNAAIMITSLRQDRTNFLGEAKILRGTPQGAVAYELARNGLKFGISTRGLGSVEEREGVKYVKEDFQWICCDAVADPSAPDCWADTILESKEWKVVYATDEKGMINESAYQIVEDMEADYKKRLAAIPKSDLETGVVKLFESFLLDLKK